MPAGVVTCPECGGRSRLPPNVEGQDKVRCPLCKGTIPLEDAPLPTAKLVPERSVTSGASAPMPRSWGTMPAQPYAPDLLLRDGETIGGLASFYWLKTPAMTVRFEPDRIILREKLGPVRLIFWIGAAIILVVILIGLAKFTIDAFSEGKRVRGKAVGAIVTLVILIGTAITMAVKGMTNIGLQYAIDRRAGRLERATLFGRRRKWSLDKAAAVCLAHHKGDAEAKTKDTLELFLISRSGKAFGRLAECPAADPNTVDVVRAAATLADFLRLPVQVKGEPGSLCADVSRAMSRLREGPAVSASPPSPGTAPSQVLSIDDEDAEETRRAGNSLSLGQHWPWLLVGLLGLLLLLLLVLPFQTWLIVALVIGVGGALLWSGTRAISEKQIFSRRLFSSKVYTGKTAVVFGYGQCVTGALVLVVVPLIMLGRGCERDGGPIPHRPGPDSAPDLRPPLAHQREAQPPGAKENWLRDPQVQPPAAKEKRLEDPQAQPPAATEGWLVVFRSSNPAIWNTNVNTDTEFALAFDKVPDDIAYLRLSREEDYVIIPMAKQSVTRLSTQGKYGFEGTVHRDSGAYHLGVFHTDWPTEKGDVCIRVAPWYRGWGFGHIHFVANIQGHCWNGETVPACVFEIALKSGKLTDAESKKLLGAP